VTTYRGERTGRGRRVAVVAARFNEVVTAKLVDGALAALAKHGADVVDVAWVPGAFEIPAVARRFAAGGMHDAVICLGAVIRGETHHFDLVANEAARGIAEVARDTGVPCIFEVLATDTLAQAEARAGGAHGNKGWEAAEAALEMVSLLEMIPADTHTATPTGTAG
jgi:6,7-dimethyl-8-ribityllumazine synthase